MNDYFFVNNAIVQAIIVYGCNIIESVIDVTLPDQVIFPSNIIENIDSLRCLTDGYTEGHTVGDVTNNAYY